MSIKFKEVSKSFNRKILDRVTFEVSKGEILFILGKSGMGKSVTLKHIVGLMKPDQGEIWVEDYPVHEFDEQKLTLVRQKCGMVFQHPALLDSLNVFDNIAFGLRTPQYIEANGKPLSEDEISRIVEEKLELVHLNKNILSYFPAELSYGMQKRVSLARTLAPSPEYLLFDEPTTGLDPITTNAINDLIYELSRGLQITSIVVSHDMNCALKIADRVLVLDQAKILALESTPEIAKNKTPLIREFLREAIGILSPEERSLLGLETEETL